MTSSGKNPVEVRLEGRDINPDVGCHSICFEFLKLPKQNERYSLWEFVLQQLLTDRHHQIVIINHNSYNSFTFGGSLYFMYYSLSSLRSVQVSEFELAVNGNVFLC